MREFEVNEDTIPLDVIDEVGHDGEYMTHEHTLEYCRVEPYVPTLCSRGIVQDPAHQYSLNIDKRLAQLMGQYEEKAPECDEAVLDQIKNIFAEQGIEREFLNSIEKM